MRGGGGGAALARPGLCHHLPQLEAGSSVWQVQVVTWGDEEGPPQLLVPRDISNLPGHVDHTASHGRDPAEVQDPAVGESSDWDPWPPVQALSPPRG